MKIPNSTWLQGINDDIVTSMNFIVMLGPTIMAFQSVSEINMVREVRYINEGGRNDYPLMLKEPKKSPHKLVFKRGRIASNSSAGMDAFRKVGDVLQTRHIMNSSGTIGCILVMNPNRELKAIYGFQSMGMIEWSLSDLDAERSACLIESMTIVHKGLVSIPVVF